MELYALARQGFELGLFSLLFPGVVPTGHIVGNPS